jgi:hypothetical protein
MMKRREECLRYFMMMMIATITARTRVAMRVTIVITRLLRRVKTGMLRRVKTRFLSRVKTRMLRTVKTRMLRSVKTSMLRRVKIKLAIRAKTWVSKRLMHYSMQLLPSLSQLYPQHPHQFQRLILVITTNYGLLISKI